MKTIKEKLRKYFIMEGIGSQESLDEVCEIIKKEVVALMEKLALTEATWMGSWHKLKQEIGG